MKKIYSTPQVEVIGIMVEDMMRTSVKTGAGKGTYDNFANGSAFDDDEGSRPSMDDAIWNN